MAPPDHPNVSLSGLDPATALPSTDTIQAFLEDNERLIQAVTALFAAGRGGEAGAYQARLHANLMWLAAVADASGAGSGGGGNAGG